MQGYWGSGAIAKFVLDSTYSVMLTVFSHSQVHEVVADLADFKNLELLVNETVTKFGGIDILVNNAGFGDVKTIEEVWPTP